MAGSDVRQHIDTILDGSNFEVWSKHMSSFLKLRKLWRYVTGEIPRPVKYQDEDESDYNGRLKDWENKNRQILTCFRNTSSVNLVSATAKEAWDILSKRYSIASQYQLCKELRDLRQSSGQSIEDFLSKMQAIWDQLALSEPIWSCPDSEDAKKFTQYQEKMRVVQFLMALHKDYEPVRTRLLQREDFLEFDRVLHELLSEETRLRNNQTNSNSVAKSASTGGPRSSLSASSVVNDQVHRNQSSSPSSMVLSTTTGIRDEMSRSKKSHWSHPHPLEMVFEGSYECNGCKMGGVGPRYCCRSCDFDLHKACMEASPKAEITVQGFKCKFLKEPKDLCTPERHKPRGRCEYSEYFCDACGMRVEGFVYHCSESDKAFHPSCAKLPPEICTQDDVKFTLQKKVRSKCQFCNKKRLQGTEKGVRGWLYASSKNNECAFHAYCVMQKAMRNPLMKKLTGTGKDLSLALEEWEQRLKTKSKGTTGGGTAIKWLKFMKLVLGTVFSILLGDPTTILATAAAHVVTEVFFHVG